MTTAVEASSLAAAPDPIREAPPISPAAAPSESNLATPPKPDEPVLDIADIQGNLLVGFNKDHVMLLFLSIDGTNEASAAKTWLRSAICPVIASSEEVLAFNRLFKATRHRRGFEGAVKSTWVNVAISAAGLHKLVPTQASGFTDAAFQSGMAARSPLLDDPAEADAEGAPANWHVGGPNNSPDLVLIVASDDPYDLYATVQHIEDTVYSFRPAGVPQPSGVRVTFKQRGQTQLGALTGHEHFGWLDGVSQPGLRGLLSGNPSDLLTPRQNTADTEQGKPGQDVLWPGEFVFGYPSQDASDVLARGRDSLTPHAGGVAVAPDWARNGSYLVFRRLRQNVAAFHQFLHDAAATAGTSPAALGSRLVGRWQSGAPVLRSPNQDDGALGADDCANNHFEFQSASEPSTGHGDQCNDEAFANSAGDQLGLVCPFSSHIRKSYPRNDAPSPGQTDPYASQTPEDPAVRQLTEADTQTHRLLRRGIPYGPSSSSHPHAPVEDTVDRGLLFLAYMTSIENQFEFVTRRWVNNPDFKELGTGIDPILGQVQPRNAAPVIKTVMPGGAEAAALALTTQSWVIPTGGDYFFAPSLSALSGVLTT